MVTYRPDPDDLNRLSEALEFVRLSLLGLPAMGATPALIVRLQLLYAEGQTLVQSPTIVDLPAFSSYSTRLESAILTLCAFLNSTENYLRNMEEEQQ